MQDLKDITHDILYEQYRTEKLSREGQSATMVEHARKVSTNPALRDQVVQQVIIKEELLKKEEEKIREREQRLQMGVCSLSSYVDVYMYLHLFIHVFI